MTAEITTLGFAIWIVWVESGTSCGSFCIGGSRRHRLPRGSSTSQIALMLRIDPTPARVRGGVQAHRCLMGRRWIILKGGNREEVLMSISSGEELWGFEGSRCGVK